MKRLFPLLFASSVLFAQPAPSRLAPQLEIRQLTGPALKLSSYKGKIVLLGFLNTGCEHCQHFSLELSQLQKDYGPKGVQVLAVVFDKDAKAGLNNFKQKFVKGFPLGYSDDITVYNWLKQPVEEGAFVPIVVFIDRKGMIVSQHLGDDMLFQDPDVNIRHKLDAMLKRTGK